MLIMFCLTNGSCNADSWTIPMVVKTGPSPWHSRNTDFTDCGAMQNVTGPVKGEFQCGQTRARYVLIQRQFEGKKSALVICKVTVIGRGKHNKLLQ